MRKAAAFCRGKNQRLSLQSQRNDGNSLSGNRDEEIIFQCLPETDADYQHLEVRPEGVNVYHHNY